VRTREWGVEGVTAVAAITVAGRQVQVAMTVSAMPVRAVTGGMRWATDRFGPYQKASDGVQQTRAQLRARAGGVDPQPALGPRQRHGPLSPATWS
jgi:hypothetical protein